MRIERDLNCPEVGSSGFSALGTSHVNLQDARNTSMNGVDTRDVDSRSRYLLLLTQSLLGRKGSKAFSTVDAILLEFLLIKADTKSRLVRWRNCAAVFHVNRVLILDVWATHIHTGIRDVLVENCEFDE